MYTPAPRILATLIVICDDTAFVAESPAMMDKLLSYYKTFTIGWRIKVKSVNPGQCKIMYSESAADTKARYFGHSLIVGVLDRENKQA